MTQENTHPENILEQLKNTYPNSMAYLDKSGDQKVYIQKGQEYAMFPTHFFSERDRYTTSAKGIINMASIKDDSLSGLIRDSHPELIFKPSSDVTIFYQNNKKTSHIRCCTGHSPDWDQYFKTDTMQERTI